MKRTKPYFPALDGLRFIAFLSVFLHHVTFYLRSGYGNNRFWQFFNYNGWAGVDVFFGLTGFLITYLLLMEKQETGKINFTDFLRRRIRRLGPLYFMAILSGFFLAPLIFKYFLHIEYINPEYGKWVIHTLPWYAVMVGNWNTAFFGWGNLRSISELWAICVDWQFYLFWPLVLMKLQTLKQIIATGIGMIIFSVLLRALLIKLGVGHPAIYTDTLARLDPFATGAIAAAILFYRPDFLGRFAFLFNSPFQLLSIIILAVFLQLADNLNRLTIRNGIFGYLPIDIISTYLVVSLVSGKSLIVRVLSSGIPKFLGKISYGLYVWHILALEAVYYAIPKINSGLFLSILALPIAVFLAFITIKISSIHHN